MREQPAVEEWVIETRRRQGLSDHVEDLAVLTELAALVLDGAAREVVEGSSDDG